MALNTRVDSYENSEDFLHAREAIESENDDDQNDDSDDSSPERVDELSASETESESEVSETEGGPHASICRCWACMHGSDMNRPAIRQQHGLSGNMRSVLPDRPAPRPAPTSAPPTPEQQPDQDDQEEPTDWIQVTWTDAAEESFSSPPLSLIGGFEGITAGEPVTSLQARAMELNEMTIDRAFHAGYVAKVKRHLAQQKAENQRLQQQITTLKGEKTSLQQQILCSQRRIQDDQEEPTDWFQVTWTDAAETPLSLIGGFEGIKAGEPVTSLQARAMEHNGMTTDRALHAGYVVKVQLFP